MTDPRVEESLRLADEYALHKRMSCLPTIAAARAALEAYLSELASRSLVGDGEVPAGYFWFDDSNGGEWLHIADTAEQAATYAPNRVVPLYLATRPQADAARKPLTHEQIVAALDAADEHDSGVGFAIRFARRIEAAHGIAALASDVRDAPKEGS